MRQVYGQRNHQGEVNITCAECRYVWVEQVDIDAYGEKSLPLNEYWTCPKCDVPFDFDEFAGDVLPLR